jgi:hypothetical protein
LGGSAILREQQGEHIVVPVRHGNEKQIQVEARNRAREKKGTNQKLHIYVVVLISNFMRWFHTHWRLETEHNLDWYTAT